MKKISNKILVLLLTCIILIGSIFSFSSISFAESTASGIDYGSNGDGDSWHFWEEVIGELGYELTGVLNKVVKDFVDVQEIYVNILKSCGYDTYGSSDEDIQEKLVELFENNTTINGSDITISETVKNAVYSAYATIADLEENVDISDYINCWYPNSNSGNTYTYFPTILDDDSKTFAVNSWTWFCENYPDEMASIMEEIKDIDYLWIDFSNYTGYCTDDSGNEVHGFVIQYIPQEYVDNNTIVSVVDYTKSSYGQVFQKFYTYNEELYSFSQVPMNYIAFFFDGSSVGYYNYKDSIAPIIFEEDEIETYKFYYAYDSYYYTSNGNYDFNPACRAYNTQWGNGVQPYGGGTFYGRGRWCVFSSQQDYANLIINYGENILEKYNHKYSTNSDGSITIYNYYTTNSDDSDNDDTVSGGTSTDYSDSLEEIIDLLEKLNNKLLYNNIVETIDTVADWYDELSDSATATALTTLGETVESAFPFSVVTDIALVMGLFVADPVTPEFTIPIDFTSINPSWYYEFTIDFADFQTLADIVKAFMLLIVIVGLIKMTPRFINNGSGD